MISAGCRSALPRIVAVVPALDEASSIAGVVENLREQEAVALHRILVVDNGSNDETGEIAGRAGASVVREERRGYGRACYAGVLIAEEADVIVLLDGDGSDDPEDLSHLVRPVLAGEADLVIGSRSLGTREPGSMSPQQVFGNRLTAALIRLLYGVKVSDMGPFRAIRRDDLLALDMQIRSTIPPDEMVRAMVHMLPAMNLEERVDMLGGMAMAPPEVFATFRDAARAILPADQFAQVARRIGIA